MSNGKQSGSGEPLRPVGSGTGPPTLDQVAALAGVSRATASRVINGGQRVSPAAITAVETAVGRLGYAPNRAARSLVTRRSDSVALLVPEPNERVFSDPFFAATLRGVSRALAATDLQLVLLLAGGGDGGARTTRYLRHRHVDGAYVVSSHRHDRLADELADIGLPCVFGGRPWTGADRVSYVDTDNVAGGRMASQRLVDHGCRRIGMIAGPPDMTSAQDRLHGWRSVLAEAGLRTDLLAHGDFTVEGGRQAVEQLMTQHADIDGLVVGSDLMAVGALPVLAAVGLRVPDDIAVVGYDDLGVAERSDPPLTTVVNPVAEMADEGVTLLLDQLAAGSTARIKHLVLPPRLVLRTSAP